MMLNKKGEIQKQGIVNGRVVKEREKSMKFEKVCNNIIIEGSEFYTLKKIETGYAAISFADDMGDEIIGNDIADHFVNVEGIEKIETIYIKYSSSLKDISLIRGFPNLKLIFVNGRNIESLEGLQYFKNEINLVISTDNNHKRSIKYITEVSLRSLMVQYAKEEDFESICKCRTIKDLTLDAFPQLSFDKMSGNPISNMKLNRGKFTELCDTVKLQDLTDLLLTGCRKIERFKGDNSGITWMAIDGSPNLDLSTIDSFTNLEHLKIFTNKKDITLSTFKTLKNLKSLWLGSCKVNLDIIDLRSEMPNLKDLFISTLKKDELEELKRLNPDVSISK